MFCKIFALSLLNREKSCRAASNNARRKNPTGLSFEYVIEHWPRYNFAVLEKIIHSHFAALLAVKVDQIFEKIFTFPCLNAKSRLARKLIAREGVNQ